MAKIMHVDDERWFLDEVRAELEALGHEVRSVDTLEEAKRIRAAEQFDLIICDGSVPLGHNGYRWAWDLYHAGQRSMVLSSDSKLGNGHPGKVPLVKKARQGRAEAIHKIITDS